MKPIPLYKPLYFNYIDKPIQQLESTNQIDFLLYNTYSVI